MAGGEFHVSAAVGAVRQSGVTLEKKAVKAKTGRNCEEPSQATL